MEIDPTRMFELLVGLPDIDVIGVADPEPGRLVVVVAAREDRPVCARCGAAAWVKDHREVDLVDLPAFNQTVTLRVIRTPVAVPPVPLRDRVVDPRASRHRPGRASPHHPGGPVGVRTGRPLGPVGGRGRRRARV